MSVEVGNKLPLYNFTLSSLFPTVYWSDSVYAFDN